MQQFSELEAIRIFYQQELDQFDEEPGGGKMQDIKQRQYNKLTQTYIKN